MTTKADIDALKLSLRAHRGHFTRYLSAADRLIQLTQASATPVLASELADILQQLNDKFKDLSDTFAALQKADPKDFDHYEDDLTSLRDKLDHAKSEVLTAIRACYDAHIVPHQAAAQAPPPTQATVRTNKALRPFRLKKDNSPVEL